MNPDEIKLDFYENGYKNKVVHYKHGEVHLTDTPHVYGIKGEQMSGYEVFFWSDKKGKIDTSRALESAVIDGGPDDQEEIAEMTR